MKIEFINDEKTIEIDENETILQASLRAGIPHTHVCGGKARCTTCRILVTEGGENLLSKPNNGETILAKKFGFEPCVRLACQTTVTGGNIKLRRLVIDDADIMLTALCGENEKESLTGTEKRLVILFADIRKFTSFSEKQLPYDIIHMLNRYFYTMRNIIEHNNGSIYNYMGDGLMALFGVDSPVNAEQDSVRCALHMLQAMDEMQPYLEQSYGQGLEIGIGIHCGDVVMGSIDERQGNRPMIIGDAVNMASRIEAQNKTLGSRLLVSEKIFQSIEDKITINQNYSVDINGISEKQMLYEVSSISD